MARTLAQAVQAELIEIRCRLQAHDIAFAVIAGALDRSGALSLQQAKSAIDQAADAIPATEQGEMARAALRELSARLMPVPGPGQRH